MFTKMGCLPLLSLALINNTALYIMCCKNLKQTVHCLTVSLCVLLCYVYSFVVSFKYDFGIFIISHCPLNQETLLMCMFTFTEINSFNTFDLCEVVL